MNFFELQKGINLKIIKTSKFKTCSIAILFKQNLERTTATLNALLPNLLSMGCHKYKDIGEISLKTEEMYGAIFHTDIIKKGDNQLIQFAMEFVPSNVKLPEVIQFLSQIILNPLTENNGFKKEYFEIAKQILSENIKNIKNDKKEYAKIRTIEEMFKEERFGVSADGYLEDLENNKITEKTLLKHYQNLLEQSEIDIILIGNLDSDVVKQNIVENFIQKLNKRRYEKKDEATEQKNKCESNFIEEEFNITQGKLCLGFRTHVLPNSDLFYPLLVGNEILGGGAGSKLFFNVREKESLCYYINSFVFLFKGVIFIQSGVDFGQAKKVITYIQNEVDNIKNGNFQQKDLDTAIISLQNKYKSLMDYTSATMDFYLTNYLACIDYSLEEVIKKIQEVNKDEIVEAFKDIWLDTCYFMKGV